jgi:CheY-like chemotaxis protein
MIKKKLLDVGNCVPDHSAIRALVTGNFDADVLQAHGPEDTLSILRKEPIALVLINRKLDRDYSDGIEILKQIKADPELQKVPVMLVTNYAEHQQAAVVAGAEYGFGKLEFQEPATIEKLARFLR